MGPRGAASDFPSYWSIALQSITAIITIIMLFTIQHLQARDQMVIRRKLDEMLRALPAADLRSSPPRRPSTSIWRR
jgi:low affinity Fe/Cu permease